MNLPPSSGSEGTSTHMYTPCTYIIKNKLTLEKNNTFLSYILPAIKSWVLKRYIASWMETIKAFTKWTQCTIFWNILSNAIRNTMYFRVYHPPRPPAKNALTYQEPFSIFFSFSSPVLYRLLVNFFFVCVSILYKGNRIF